MIAETSSMVAGEPAGVEPPRRRPARSHPRAATIALVCVLAGAVSNPACVARAAHERADAGAQDDYDPWASFNRPMFWFNHGVLDRYVVKPPARAWDRFCPHVVRRGIGRAIDNLKMPRRVINNLLQGHLIGAGAEAGRFVVNTTVGVAGVLDVAERLHLEKSEADMGETLGVWGLQQGPYLVLPFLAPLTVRDGVGRAVDAVLDPLWLVPFFGGTVVGLVNAMNDRSLNLRLFADVEDSTIDLYSAVRNGYLQRRRHVVARRRSAVFGGAPSPPPAPVTAAAGGGA